MGEQIGSNAGISGKKDDPSLRPDSVYVVKYDRTEHEIIWGLLDDDMKANLLMTRHPTHAAVQYCMGTESVGGPTRLDHAFYVTHITQLLTTSDQPPYFRWKPVMTALTKWLGIEVLSEFPNTVIVEGEEIEVRTQPRSSGLCPPCQDFMNAYNQEQIRKLRGGR